MLDTLYKTNNTKCLQLLLKYRKGKLESIVRGVEYYDTVCCDGVRHDVTHPDSAHVETAF